MSRNSGGTYSLPSGNPVVTGTTISSTVHNNTMSDMGTEVTDSLCRSGKGAMLAALPLYVGTVSVPSLSFDGDADTGLYHIGSNNPGMAVGGVLNQSWASTGSTFALGLIITQSQTNGVGVTSTGNGSGAGLAGTGGATGAGVTGTGGASSGAGGAFTATNGNGIGATGAGNGSGAGLAGTGGATGAGVTGTGGASGGAGGVFLGSSNANGVSAVANGSGAGITAQGGSGAGGDFTATTGYGVKATGNTTRAPLRIVGQSAEPNTPQNGDIYYDTDTDKLRLYAAGAWVDVN